MRIQLVHTIDPHRLDFTVQALREKGCSETIKNVVSLSDYAPLVLAIPAGPDFFSDNLHVRGSVGEDGGSDEVAFCAFAFTADVHLGILARCIS